MGEFSAWLLAEETSHIKVDLPAVRQNHDYDCGAAALRSVAEFFGTGPDQEKAFMDLAATSKKDGTSPQNMMDAAKLMGLEVSEKYNMSLPDLMAALDACRPVICCVQAWGKPKKYDENKHGHYIVAIGYDEENVYFEDPVLTKTRGHMPQKEFLDRWHDTDGKREFKRHGIIVWSGRRHKKPEREKESRTAKIK